MKKHRIVLPLFASVLLLSGCYELDQYPGDKVSSQIFWKTESQARQAMMGVYADMKNENAFGTAFGLDCLSDIGQGYDAAAYSTIALGTYTVRSGEAENKWKTLYDGIMRANAVIRDVPKVDMPGEQIATYIGEAKFMRALYYFQLLDFFGGVPLYDESVVLDDDFNSMKEPRATTEQVRIFIIQDLEAAAASLPVKWSDSEYGRATKGAAYSLKGKVLLFAKNYAEAAKSFEEVVNDPAGAGYGYNLYPNYADLFKPTGDQSEEMIFAIQNAGGVGMDYGMPMTFYMGSRSSFGSCWNNVMVATDFVDSYEYKDGKPFNWNDLFAGFNESAEVKDRVFRATMSDNKAQVVAYPESKEQLLNMYEQRDPRMAASILLPYTRYKGWLSNAPNDCEFVVAVGTNENNGFIRNNNGWECYLWRKFVAEYDMNGAINDRAHTPVNFPLIRYADVLLMLAECYNETGRQAEAVTLINQVRSRVGMPGLNSGPAWLSATTREELFVRIKHERAVELAAEGHRFSDLRRWGLLLQLNKKIEYGFTGQRQFTRQVLERDYLWPVPATEIEKNAALAPNNPGWD